MGRAVPLGLSVDTCGLEPRGGVCRELLMKVIGNVFLALGISDIPFSIFSPC